MEFPHVQEMRHELLRERIELIGIADPPRDSLVLMLNQHHADLPVAIEDRDHKDTTSIQRQWQAGVKVWFVVDSTRRVLYVGNYNPTKIRAALGQLGAKWERKGKY